MSGVLAGLADAWRIAFLTISAPVIGAVLMLAIARVTGADWRPFTALTVPAFWLVPAGALVALGALAHPAPDHLALWLSCWGVASRAVIVTTALAFAAKRLRAETHTTFAAIVLAAYAVVVTPVASDWMLGQAPGHPVSAIGMMHLTECVAGATAVALALRLGSDPFRRDMARLMIAAALGLAYMAYMDYLIVWFGNLPARVGFYIERGTPGMALLVWAGLATGLLAPILLLWLAPEERGERFAGLSVLAALLLFNLWWVAGGLLALLGGLLLCLLAVAAAKRLVRRSVRHV